MGMLFAEVLCFIKFSISSSFNVSNYCEHDMFQLIHETIALKIISNPYISKSAKRFIYTFMKERWLER